MGSMMESYVDKVVQIVTNDGRNIVGLLKGFDQTTNLVLDECHERVFSSTAGVEQVCLRRLASRQLVSCSWPLLSDHQLTCAGCTRPLYRPG